MNDWVDASTKLPDENAHVLVMLKDASGFNATYRSCRFYPDKHESDFVNASDVKFWKTSDGTTFQQAVKRCGMCGRFR